jgi:hypothetical protein
MRHPVCVRVCEYVCVCVCVSVCVYENMCVYPCVVVIAGILELGSSSNLENVFSNVCPNVQYYQNQL